MTHVTWLKSIINEDTARLIVALTYLIDALWLRGPVLLLLWIFWTDGFRNNYRKMRLRIGKKYIIWFDVQVNQAHWVNVLKSLQRKKFISLSLPHIHTNIIRTQIHYQGNMSKKKFKLILREELSFSLILSNLWWQIPPCKYTIDRALTPQSGFHSGFSSRGANATITELRGARIVLVFFISQE